MARTSATIFGLTLIVFSIWFNSVRYPVVWQMVDPGAALRKTDETAPRMPNQTTAPVDVSPAPEATDKPTIDDAFAAPIVAEDPTANVMTVTDGRAVATSASKSLIPVVFSINPEAERSESSVRPSVNRLPPVERIGSVPLSADGSIPVYPSTGIE